MKSVILMLCFAVWAFSVTLDTVRLSVEQGFSYGRGVVPMCAVDMPLDTDVMGPPWGCDIVLYNYWVDVGGECPDRINSIINSSYRMFVLKKSFDSLDLNAVIDTTDTSIVSDIHYVRIDSIWGNPKAIIPAFLICADKYQIIGMADYLALQYKQTKYWCDGWAIESTQFVLARLDFTPTRNISRVLAPRTPAHSRNQYFDCIGRSIPNRNISMVRGVVIKKIK